jgi:hypothetical protein
VDRDVSFGEKKSGIDIDSKLSIFFSSSSSSSSILLSRRTTTTSLIVFSYDQLECIESNAVLKKQTNRSMTEFEIRINRLTERLRRGTIQCDHVEQRACLTEERLSTLNESIQNLARLIEVSLLIIVSSDKDKSAWIQLIDNEHNQLANPIIKQFFYRLESYFHRSVINHDEKLAYIQALTLIRKPLIVSSCILSK